MNRDASFWMSDHATLRMSDMLIIKLEDSSRFSLTFNGISFSDVVISEFRVESKSIEAVTVDLLDLFRIF